MKLRCVLKNLRLPIVSLMLKRFCGVDCFQISGKVAMLKKNFKLNDVHGKCGKKGRKLQEKQHVLCFWHSMFHIPTPCPCVIPEHLMDEKDNC